MVGDKRTKGFTIIELVVVIIILGLMAAMAVTAYRSTQASTRDSQRQVSAQIIADQLEGYYDKYNAYPTCVSMQTFASVSSIMPRLEKKVLIDPRAEDKTVPSILCEDLTSDSTYVYALVGEDTCGPTIACQSFKLRYREEGSGEVKEIVNKNRS